jgi:hypothetical protein
MMMSDDELERMRRLHEIAEYEKLEARLLATDLLEIEQ